MSRAAVLLLLTALVAAAHAAPGDAPAPATSRYESADGGVSVELPAEWKAVRLPPQQAILRLRIVSERVGGGISFVVFSTPGLRNERGQAHVERAAQQTAYKTDAPGEVRLDPMPHLEMDFPESGEMLRHVWIFRVVGRMGFSVTVSCRYDAWPSIRDACFHAAATLTSRLGEYPSRPDGYAVSLRDGYEYLVHPAVKTKDVDGIHAAVMEQERRYAVVHGPVPKPAANPIVVVVTPDKAAAATLSPDAASKNGYSANYLEGRVFAVPMKPDDALGRADLADRLACVFHIQSYGAGAATWLRDGERRVAAVEAAARRPLPAVLGDYVPEFARSLLTFEELVKRPPKDVVAQSASYVAFFRAGPKLYHDAFAEFLHDLAATGDWEAAQTKRLLSLDQEKLRAAAQEFVAKDLKPR